MVDAVPDSDIFLQSLNNSAAYGVQASDNLSYLFNPLWWAGMSMRTFILQFALDSS